MLMLEQLLLQVGLHRMLAVGRRLAWPADAGRPRSVVHDRFAVLRRRLVVLLLLLEQQLLLFGEMSVQLLDVGGADRRAAGHQHLRAAVRGAAVDQQRLRRGRVQLLQHGEHRVGELLRVVLGREVQPVDQLRVAPLVKGVGRLVVLEALQDGAVDHQLRKVGKLEEERSIFKYFSVIF